MRRVFAPRETTPGVGLRYAGCADRYASRRITTVVTKIRNVHIAPVKRVPPSAGGNLWQPVEWGGRKY